MLEATFDTLSIEDQIDLAEWEVSRAKAHLADLKRQKSELDAHIEAQYQAHLDAQFGRVACESDAHDCKVREVRNVSR